MEITEQGIYFNIFFILYIFFFKYRNRQYIKRNLILKNIIISNSIDKKRKNRKIKNLYNLNNYYKKIKKTYDSMIYEFNLYKEIIVDLQNKNEKLLKSEIKYKKSYEDLLNITNNLNSSHKSLSRDMDKISNSYKDLYNNHKKLTDNFDQLLEKNNSLEQKCVNLDSELFIYKNIKSSYRNRINLLEEIDSKQKIELLKSRNLLKKYKKEEK